MKQWKARWQRAARSPLAVCRLRCATAAIVVAVVTAALSPLAMGSATAAEGQDVGGIVSIGGTITEIAYVLGAGDRILAVDSTSLYPPAATDKPNVGYMRQLAAEPILALAPELIVAVEDSGPPNVLDQIGEAGIPIVLVPDSPTYEGVLDKVARVAAALGTGPDGERLVGQLRADFDGLTAAVAELSERPRVLFLLSVGQGGAPLAAGRDTSAAGIIELSGGINAVDAFEGYKPLSPEAAVAAEPDVLLITERSLDLLGGRDALLALPEVAITPAGQSGRILSLDGLLLLGFGPRTGRAVRWLAGELHPELALPAARRD